MGNVLYHRCPSQHIHQNLTTSTCTTKPLRHKYIHSNQPFHYTHQTLISPFNTPPPHPPMHPPCTQLTKANGWLRQAYATKTCLSPQPQKTVRGFPRSLYASFFPPIPSTPAPRLAPSTRTHRLPFLSPCSPIFSGHVPQRTCSIDLLLFPALCPGRRQSLGGTTMRSAARFA